MPSVKLADQIHRATDRLAQLKARELLQRHRAAAKAKADARRADAHRKIELGGLVIACDLEAWDPAEIVGMLLDAKDRCIHSTVIRAGLRKRGVEYLAVRKADREGRPAV